MNFYRISVLDPKQPHTTGTIIGNLIKGWCFVFRLGAGVIAGAVLCIVIVTYVALESSDVLVVETVNHSGEENRLTHIWYVLENGKLILEAGNPMNPWVLDIEQRPEVRLTGEGLDGDYQLSINRDPSGHARVRSLMREKYGWRDLWIALLFDTSNSMLVEAYPRRKSKSLG